MAVRKYIKNNGGVLTEEATVDSTTGAVDGSVVSLNSDTVVDPALLNAASTSSGGVDADKIAQLGGDGKLSPTMMPTGFGDDAVSLPIKNTEVIANGAFVNIFDDGGTAKIQNADATSVGKQAHGFILTDGGTGDAGGTVTSNVFFEGENSEITGATIGDNFLSTTPGGTTTAAPSGAGNVVQRLGFATSAVSLNVEFSQPLVLA